MGETSELRRSDVIPDASVIRVHQAVTYRSGRFFVRFTEKRCGVRDVAGPCCSVSVANRGTGELGPLVETVAGFGAIRPCVGLWCRSLKGCPRYGATSAGTAAG